MTKFLNISTDNTLGGNSPSDELAVSQKAIKDYVDQHGGGGGSYTAGNGIDITNDVISVTTPTLVNEATGRSGLIIIGSGNPYSLSYTAITVLGSSAQSFSEGGVCVGNSARVANSSGFAIAIGSNTGANAKCAIQLGGSGNVVQTRSNSDANTFKVGNENGNFEIMSADGTIPEARLADTTNAAQGQVLTLDSNLNAVWQAGGGGSSYTAGTGIDITSGVISVENPVYTNTDGTGLEGITIGRSELQYSYGDGAIIIGATTMPLPGRDIGGAVVIGGQAKTQWGGCIAIGGKANADGDVSIAIGGGSCAATGAGAIQLGFNQTNADDNTFKVANLNGNFEIMSADGTIPEGRLADTTNAAQGQVLTLDNNLNAVWANAGGGSSYTAGNGIDITGTTISVDDLDCGTMS